VIETMKASDYAVQIVRLLADPAAGKRMGENARFLVREQFHWGRVGSLFADMASRVDTDSPRAGLGVASQVPAVQPQQ
jgi:hypothetical protein